MLKPVVFRGSALKDLREFPEDARREAGYQFDQVQRGREPDGREECSGDSNMGRSRDVQGDLRRDIADGRLCPALLQEDDPADVQS